ncbi:uncharacterized protein LOC116173008 [Photinus pyralis]|uniref:uncharacterized protein LOC116173008 n=1 Tax=Photinus pyralis TaxID=7054 RepID=UPI0012671F17|nr:uncharacterized protein LOC116173008 [Photinus pyralis]
MVSKITEISLNKWSARKMFLLHLHVDEDTIEDDFEGLGTVDSAVTSYVVPPGRRYMLVIGYISCNEKISRKTHYVFINKELRVIVKSAGVVAFRIVFGTPDCVWKYMERHLSGFANDEQLRLKY